MSCFPLLFYSMASSLARGRKKPPLPQEEDKRERERGERRSKEREREGTRRRRKVRCVGGLERGGKYYESIFLTDWQSPRRHLFREK